MTQETRKDTRARIVSLNVRYKSASVDDFIENHAHDVSTGGIFIRTSNGFAPGTLMKFEIRIASDASVISGVGRVVWKREPSQASSERPAGMGVKFIKIDDASRAVIQRLVTSRLDAGKSFETETEGLDAEGLSPGYRTERGLGIAAPAELEALVTGKGAAKGAVSSPKAASKPDVTKDAGDKADKGAAPKANLASAGSFVADRPSVERRVQPPPIPGVTDLGDERRSSKEMKATLIGVAPDKTSEPRRPSVPPLRDSAPPAKRDSLPPAQRDTVPPGPRDSAAHRGRPSVPPPLPESFPPRQDDGPPTMASESFATVPPPARARQAASGLGTEGTSRLPADVLEDALRASGNHGDLGFDVSAGGAHFSPAAEDLSSPSGEDPFANPLYSMGNPAEAPAPEAGFQGGVNLGWSDPPPPQYEGSGMPSGRGMSQPPMASASLPAPAPGPAPRKKSVALPIALSFAAVVVVVAAGLVVHSLWGRGGDGTTAVATVPDPSAAPAPADSSAPAPSAEAQALPAASASAVASASAPPTPTPTVETAPMAAPSPEDKSADLEAAKARAKARAERRKARKAAAEAAAAAGGEAGEAGEATEASPPAAASADEPAPAAKPAKKKGKKSATADGDAPAAPAAAPADDSDNPY